MTIEISTGLRQAMLNATGMKAGMANGVIYIYSGSQPVSPDAAVQGTLLMIVTKDHGAFSFGTATNGLNFDAPVAGVLSKAAAENWQGIGIAAGVAGWFRHMANPTDALGVSTTLLRMDGSIANAGADLNLVGTTIAVGTPLTIDVYQYTLPTS
jgi:hypothetical protein